MRAAPAAMAAGAAAPADGGSSVHPHKVANAAAIPARQRRERPSRRGEVDRQQIGNMTEPPQDYWSGTRCSLGGAANDAAKRARSNPRCEHHEHAGSLPLVQEL